MLSVRCKYLWCICVSGIFGIALLVLGIVIPSVLDKVIKGKAADQTIMSEANINLWGQVPGKSGVTILRNFTFFDFVNPLDVMFRDAKPKFNEVGPFSYQEFQNFTEPKFNDDNSIVNFKFWVHVNKLGEQNVSQKIHFANYAALGAWYQINTVDPATITLQIMGQLIFGIEALILPTAYSNFLQPNIAGDYETARAGILVNLTEKQALFVYNDVLYGMGNGSSFISWYNSARGGDNSGSSDLLRNYFDLNFTQLSQMNEFVSGVIAQIDEAGLLTDAFCDSKVCTPRYLVANQWATQGLLTSIAIGNNTSFGYPEISYFYKSIKLNQLDYFRVTIDKSPEYQNLSFTIPWALKVLSHANYTLEDRQFLTDPWLLLNIGNMRLLFRLGQAYDEKPDPSILEQIRVQFLLDSVQQARVFWEYVKYIGFEFGMQKSKNGTSAITSMGAFISQTIFKEFQDLVNNLHDRIISDMLLVVIPKCQDVLINVPGITEGQILAFCSRSEFQTWNSTSLQEIVEICDPSRVNLWTEIQDSTQMTNLQLQNLCQSGVSDFGIAQAAAEQQLQIQYGCKNSETKCSRYEIAIKQWLNSQITLNPPYGLWHSTNTVANVYPDLFPVPLEYFWFYDEFSDVLPRKKLITEVQAGYLLSFDCLFSAVMVENSFIYETNNNLATFRTWFVVDEFKQLNHYLRYLLVQVTFGGLAQEKTVEEILFGYDDFLLSQLATMDPAQGGDPSIPYSVSLQPNVPLSQAEPQSMFTGRNDSNLIRKYHQVNGVQYFTAPTPYFDGKTVQKFFINPWEIESQLDQGTDALFFHPDYKKGDKITVVITDLLRSVDLTYDGTKEVFGVETYHMALDTSFLAINESFHNTQFYGLVNFTSVQHAPIFNSLPHFYRGDPKLAQFVEIYKDDHLQLANEYDTSYVYLEPYSGVAVKALVNIQINVEYKSDILFPGQSYSLMPVVWLYRGANLTEGQIEDNFGPLKTGLKAKKVIFWVGILLGPALIILAGALFYFKVYKVKQEQDMVVNESHLGTEQLI